MVDRTLKANFVINSIGAVVPVAVALVTVPIYVRQVGDARFGVLSIIWVLLGYFGFLDLGLSHAATNALSRLRDAPQEARARVLVTTLILNCGLGLFGGLCLALLGSFFLQNVLAVPEPLKVEIAQAVPWLVGLVPLALVSGVGIGALESRESFLVANVIQVSGSALGQIVPVIVAIAVGPSLAVVIPAAVTVRVLTVAVVLLVVCYEARPLSLAAFDRHQIRTLLSYGGWISLSGIINPILTSLDQFLIGSILSIASVTYYAVPMNLVTRSQIFAGALARTLFPRMSNANPEEARRLAQRALLALAYGYAAICAPAVMLTPVFLKYWIGAGFAAAAAPVAQILFFGAWINGLAFVPYGMLQAQGRPDITGKLHAAEVIPFVAIVYALTSTYGIVGAAVAWTLRTTADAACLFWAAGTPVRVLVQTIALPLCLLTASHAASGYIGSDLWLSTAAAAALGVAGAMMGVASSKDLRTALSLFALRMTPSFGRMQKVQNTSARELGARSPSGSWRRCKS
jgi:O-antigen/teichoic acid export membrane protein